MRKHLSTVLLLFILFIGLSLLLYPSVSNYWNSFHATRAIASYSEVVDTMDSETLNRLWNDAQHAQYEATLDVSGTGIMGTIEIPSIKVSLPIYHGVEDSVLQIAAGHIEGSSLPVGGAGTHCVLSGHRGLPSAKLFTNLDELVEGDVFMLRVLDQVLTYEVDQILIVEPQDVSALEIEEGKDYCTLVTCTPYGINTHRLLVRGHRTENLDPDFIRVAAEALPIDPVLVAPLVAAPILILLFVIVMVKYRKK